MYDQDLKQTCDIRWIKDMYAQLCREVQFS